MSCIVIPVRENSRSEKVNGEAMNGKHLGEVRLWGLKRSSKQGEGHSGGFCWFSFILTSISDTCCMLGSLPGADAGVAVVVTFHL